ncbi:excinuclease ABC subunit UvrB [Candidatus Woesearchaeota archaeon]|nr:excinuclease ABC subunit UvrB [Candidatus Woesearchaeota archaeon]
MKFKIDKKVKPKGGQPEAIKKLVEGYKKYPKQTLLGITGSGKTFVMANVINSINKPAIIIAHNKTLAAQLYTELKQLFKENRVEYFVSYYDYYQPESYIPQTDTYIEKDAKINAKIEQMRLKATASLMSRKDVIIVASVSCIYGLGDPKDFQKMSYTLNRGDKKDRMEVLRGLVGMQYERNDQGLEPGKFRVRGDVIDIIPGYEDTVIRIELFGDKVEKITELDAINNKKIRDLDEITIYPSKHFVIPEEKQEYALAGIEDELKQWAPTLNPLERNRLEKRTRYDIEMIREVGYCTGIENYSRYFDRRKKGEPPFCLLDYFPEDFLVIIDESHQTIPQLHAMYKGDWTRKKNLVDYGFRLPSAFDNRPLKFNEFQEYMKHTIFVSATPAEYEKEVSKQIAELIIRPTGLLDPECEVRPTKHQVDDLIAEIDKTTKKGYRTLVTTLTKRMAEDLTDYLSKAGIKVRYLHSEIDTIERTEIIRQLRLKEFDVLVGINLLREGLDIPEVALVAILDADKEGFLRNERSLIQTIGRAARNEHGRVIMYADVMTESLKSALEITKKRRERQIAYNKKKGIVPKTIVKPIQDSQVKIKTIKHIAKSQIPAMIATLDADMKNAAEKLDFEKAMELRDEIENLRKQVQK